jgi:hypothetical protein
VSDGSTSPACLFENKKIIENLKAAAPVTLIGRRERHHLTERLVSAGVDDKIVTFGLNGLDYLDLTAIGANRNVLLLATVGENFLSVDDDTEFLFANADQFRSNPVTEWPRRVANEPSIQHWLYPDRKSLQDSVEFEQLDFIAAHESILGAEVRSLALSLEQGYTLVSSALGSQAGGGRVVLTLSGVIGDCGWGTPSRYLFLNEASLERITRSDEVYLRSITTREMAQLTKSLVLTRQPEDLMAGAFAADSQLPFPPFMPAGRGEDVVLGHVLQKLYSDVWFGHLPHAIFHAPAERRRFRPREVLRSATTIDVGSLLSYIISQLTITKAGPFGTLRELGRSLEGIGMMPTLAFRSYIRSCSGILNKKKISLLEDRLSTLNGAARSYTDDVKTYMQRLLQGDKREEAGIPAELLYGRELGVALECTQKFVTMYGQLLYAWPDMIEVVMNGS